MGFYDNERAQKEQELTSVVEVTLIEREGTSNENLVTKRVVFSDDCLNMVDDVLPVFEDALRGLGFVMEGKHLSVVRDEPCCCGR